MIGIWGSRDREAMRQRTADLEQQVATLSARLATTTDQLDAAIGRLERQATELAGVGQQVGSLATVVADQAARAADTEQHAEALATVVADQAARAADTERRAEALAGVVADQAAAIERLNGQEERRKELDGRVRADMIRIERQAAIDATESRETSRALAERLLMFRRQDIET